MTFGHFKKLFAITVANAALAFLLSASAYAKTESKNHLIIGSTLSPSSIDPHFHASGENNTLLPHIYDALITLDQSFNAVPNLATSWLRVSDTVWEFTLRENVYFHDGSLLTTADIAYTFDRIPYVKNSPGSFQIYTKKIAKLEILGAYTFRIHTVAIHNYLLHDLSAIMILPENLGFNIATPAFNSGKAAIGTGPYKLIKWRPGEGLDLTRNPKYWGGLQPWKTVTLQQISSAPTRVAALLSGTVDMIDQVPLADRERLARSRGIKITEHEASRIMFVALDSARDNSPFVRGAEGQALQENPLKNKHVRHALSLAIDRDAIVKYLLDGAGEPAGQILPAAFSEGARTLAPDEFNPKKAKKMLSDAGYTNGFQITLHSPSDRYPNDAKVAQAVAQMWWKIGVETQVETQTKNVFFPAAARQEFSAYFSGWATTYNAEAMAGLLHSYVPEQAMGQGNRARYSNPEADQLIKAVQTEANQERRNTMAVKAQEIVFQEEHGVLPLYFPTYSWAYRSDRITYNANAEGSTQAMRARPAATPALAQRKPQ